ncbi:unnamed protein product [Amoebophrya sp. A25]|nr:unnamed protein product [Amoebophrya sp. A25]|eukprot:GSA25T00010893001.1
MAPRRKRKNSDSDPEWVPESESEAADRGAQATPSAKRAKRAAASARQGNATSHPPGKSRGTTTTRESVDFPDDLEDEFEMQEEDFSARTKGSVLVGNRVAASSTTSSATDSTTTLIVKNVQARTTVDIPGGLDLERVRRRLWNVELVGGAAGRKSRAALAAHGSSTAAAAAEAEDTGTTMGGSTSKNIGLEQRFVGSASGSSQVQGPGGGQQQQSLRKRHLQVMIYPPSSGRDNEEDDKFRIFTSFRSDRQPIVASIFPNGTLTIRGDLRQEGEDHSTTTGMLQQHQLYSGNSSSTSAAEKFETALAQIRGVSRLYLKKLAMQVLKAHEEQKALVDDINVEESPERTMIGKDASAGLRVHHRDVNTRDAGVNGDADAAGGVHQTQERRRTMRHFQVSSIWAYLRLPFLLDLPVLARAFPNNSSYIPEVSPCLKLEHAFDTPGLKIRVFRSGVVEFFCSNPDTGLLLAAAVRIQTEWDRFRPIG